MMQALELLWLAKRYFSVLSSEEIKPIALVVIELHLSEDISQSDSQLVENLLNKNYFKNFIATKCNGLEIY